MPVGAHFTHVLFVCKSVLDLLTYEPLSLKNVPEGPAHLIGAKDRWLKYSLQLGSLAMAGLQPPRTTQSHKEP